MRGGSSSFGSHSSTSPPIRGRRWAWRPPRSTRSLSACATTRTRSNDSAPPPRRDRELHPAIELERATARLRDRRARRGKMSRSELKGRIDALRRDPALPAPARVLFRNKTEEEASDEELESLLDQLEDIVE